MRLYKHLRERGARILLAAVDAPPTEWKSPLAAFEAAYASDHGRAVAADSMAHVARRERLLVTEHALRMPAR
jgi:ferritin